MARVIPSKKKFLSGMVAVLVLCAAGGVIAYWTQGGAGTGTATTDTPVDVVVNQTSTVAGLFPDGPAGALSGNFDNPNDGPVKIGSVTATVTATDDVGCDKAWYSVGGTAAVDAEIPAGNGVGAWSGLTVQLNDEPLVNQDACKGATITITYAVTAGA